MAAHCQCVSHDADLYNERRSVEPAEDCLLGAGERAAYEVEVEATIAGGRRAEGERITLQSLAPEGDEGFRVCGHRTTDERYGAADSAR